MFKDRFLKVLVVVLGAFVLNVIWFSDGALAANTSTIVKKWIFTDYYNCANNYIRSPILQQKSGKVVESIFQSGQGMAYMPSEGFQQIYSNGTAVDCKQLLVGTAGLSNNVSAYAGIGAINWSNMNAAQGLMEKFGYEMEETDNFRFRIIATKTTVRKICYSNATTLDCSNPKTTREEVQSTMVTVSRRVDGIMYPSLDSVGSMFSDFKLQISRVDGTNVYMSITPKAELGACSVINGPSGNKIEFLVGNNIQEFNKNVEKALSNVTFELECTEVSQSGRMTIDTKTYTFKKEGDGVSNSVENGQYVFPTGLEKYSVINKSIEAMSGMSVPNLILDNNELYTLYLYYLNSALPAGAANRLTCQWSSNTSGMRQVRLKVASSGSFSNCYINTSGLNMNKQFYTQSKVVGPVVTYPYISTITLNGIIQWFNTVDEGTLTDVPLVYEGEIDFDNNDSATSTEDDEKVCYSGSGAIGWIICPIVGAVSGIGEFMWQGMVEPNLVTPANQLFGEDTGVSTAWGIVRDIGNIVFVILLLTVVFSQLTGVGIDNYGIKRMLPRLIIAAVLMNLSYYVCAIAIDASNIVGSGINSLLTNLSNDVASANGASLGAGLSGFTFDLALGGGVFALFALLGGGMAVVGASIGLAVLGLVVSMVFSLLALYLTLLVREAGVILCVVLAPIAIALYILPNTEKMYKKWFGIFKALLIVYPLCGAVLGAGRFAGAILAGGDEPGMKIAAMLIQVLPFLLIPMLLRNSLSLLGNVGARISTMGRNLGRRSSGALQGGIRNSERFKDWQQFYKQADMTKKAQRLKTRLNGISGGDETKLNARQRHLMSWANETLQGQHGRERRDTLGASEVSYQAGLLHQDASFSNEREKMFAENFKYESERGEIDKALGEALAGNDAERASAAMKELINRGGITEAIGRMMGADWDQMDDRVRQRVVQAMGETNVDVFKSFSKYQGSKGRRGFRQWATGQYTSDAQREMEKKAGVKDVSYAAHLHENGYGAMNAFSKDEMQFIEGHFGEIAQGLGASGQEELAGMLATTAISSKDAKAQTVAENTITKQIAAGADISSMGITASMIGDMRTSMVEAMIKGYEGRGMERAQAESRVRAELSKQIVAAKQDQRIRNRMNSGVAEMLGVDRAVAQVGGSPSEGIVTVSEAGANEFLRQRGASPAGNNGNNGNGGGNGWNGGNRNSGWNGTGNRNGWNGNNGGNGANMWNGRNNRGGNGNGTQGGSGGILL